MSKVYWAVRYGVTTPTWVSQVDPVQGRFDKKLRHLFPTQREALKVASEIVYPPVVLVRVIKRPKPALKVGDAVLVRCRYLGHANTEDNGRNATVSFLCHAHHRGNGPHGATVSIREEDIVRAAKGPR